jgi:hypothetical protein
MPIPEDCQVGLIHNLKGPIILLFFGTQEWLMAGQVNL